MQFLRPIQKCVSLKSHKGSVVAVDAMCWIHRGMISSAVANVTGEACDKYIKFIISMLAVLLSYDITPIMVFDGYEMPSKERENQSRSDRRNKARAEALEMIKKNKGAINTEIMRKCMQAISITPEVIARVMEICREMNVRVLVAPYEADAQVAYLCRAGIAHAAISEDSDLLAYGCPRVWYKLERDGRADEISLNFNSHPDVKCSKGLLKGISHRMFVAMCVLSGSDYDDGCHINGMGIKLAHRFILQYETVPAIMAELEENLSWAKKLPTHVTLKQLEDHYLNVSKIFLHNVVYDIRTNSLTHINPIPHGEQNLDIIVDLCFRIRQRADFNVVSAGHVNPRNGEPLIYEITPNDKMLTEGMKFADLEGVVSAGTREESEPINDLLLQTTLVEQPKEAVENYGGELLQSIASELDFQNIIGSDTDIVNPPSAVLSTTSSTECDYSVVARTITEDSTTSISTCDEFYLPTKSQKGRVRDLINSSERVTIVRPKRACVLRRAML